MIPDPLRLGLEEPPGVLQQNPPPRQVTAERPIGEEAVESLFADGACQPMLAKMLL